MVAITCMLVVANVQSSVGEMIPKTSYFKMIDYFLLFSLNIIIIVMVYHTYQAAHIAEDFAPNEDDKEMQKVKLLHLNLLNLLNYLKHQIKQLAEERASEDAKNNLWSQFLVEGGAPVDRLEDAARINKQGQIFFVVAFFFFQIVFWSVALAENYSE